jgi:phosphoribosyl-dephospho-CoA transferase
MPPKTALDVTLPSKASALQRHQLVRHQLVRLSAKGWAAVHEHATRTARNHDIRECLAFWSAQNLPLVVTTQTPGATSDYVQLGLAAPLQWDRQRISVRASFDDIDAVLAFPPAQDVISLLPPARRAAAQGLFDTLREQQTKALIFGSYGWQYLTGCQYLHLQSDIDLLLHVSNSKQADSVVQSVAKLNWINPRIDGEIAFANGDAVAWREWQNWRLKLALDSHAGNAKRNEILVKRIHGAALESGTEWLEDALNTDVYA